MLSSLSKIQEYEKENYLNQHRREPANYCTILVVTGYADDGIKWWYWMLEGEELFCKIERNQWNEITGYYPCRLTNTKIEIGRSISPKDCIML